MTVEDQPEDRIVETADEERLDREALRAHRAKLLASQSLTVREMDLKNPPKSPRADLTIAAIYTLYVVPMTVWVMGLGTSQGHFWLATAIAATALCSLVLLWRQYSRAWQRIRRSRVYVGVLVEKQKVAGRDDLAALAVFEGGKIEIPQRLHDRLIPGVRYRVHAPETDDIAVDVALDDEEPAQRSAYR